MTEFYDPYPWPKTGEIHIWIANIRDWLLDRQTLQTVLDHQEQRRLARYKTPAKKDQFLCSRGLLKYILGIYLDSEPETLEISQSQLGKPYLKDQPLSFNLSHSEDYLVFAIGKKNRIGIDIEKIYPVSNLEKMIQKIFSPADQDHIASLDSGYRLEHFFAIWTAKEAYLKALGAGFKRSPINIDILINSDPIRTYQVYDFDHPDHNKYWSITALDLPQGYLGAAAVDGILKKIVQIPLVPRLFH